MKKNLIIIVMLCFTAACVADVQNDKTLPSENSTVSDSAEESDGTSIGITPSSTENEISDEIDGVLPTNESMPSNEVIPLTEGDQMPIFIEIVQTTIISTESSQAPNIGVGPAVYIYQPDSKVILLHSSVVLDAGTELLIGENDILQTPDMTYERKVMLQYPTEQFTLIQVAGFAPDTEILTLVYGGETFSLSAGESWTSKEIAEGGTPTLITVVTNYGRLTGIETLSNDGGSR